MAQYADRLGPEDIFFDKEVGILAAGRRPWAPRRVMESQDVAVASRKIAWIRSRPLSSNSGMNWASEVSSRCQSPR